MEDVPIIRIRSARGIWQLFDLDGQVTDFESRDVAVSVAYLKLRERKGIIEIVDATGRCLESIDLRTHDPRHP